jgi:hypothetical protein
MEQTEIATWHSMAGGSTNMQLEAGPYRLDGGTVAPLTLTDAETSDERGFPVITTEEHVGEPLDPAGFTVTADHRLHRLAWKRGHVVLYKVTK